MKSLKTRIIPILWILLLVLAFLLRSKMIINGDFYYLVDQARDLLLTQSIVMGHKLTLIGARTGLGGLFHGALWLYMIIPFFILAKSNPFFTLIPLFELVNLGIIVTGFFVGQKLYGKWMGLLFALFLTTSSVLTETVPFTSNAQVLPIIFLLYLYAIIEFIRGKEKQFIFALLYVGLGFQFESAFAILLLPLTIVAIAFRKKLPTLKNTLLGIIAFLAAVSTFIIFDLRHKFLMTTSFFKLFTNPVKPLPGYEQYAHLSFRFQDRCIALWNSLFAPLFSANTISSTILIAILLLAIISVIKDISKNKKYTIANKEFLFILSTPIVIFGIYILYPLPLWPHYLLPIAALSVFILSLSIKQVWKWPVIRPFIYIFLIITLFPTVVWIKDNYINAPKYQPISDGSYENQKEVAKWVIGDTRNKEYGYFVYTPGILTYNMDYLLWYESYRNKLRTPSNFKHPITYLILYPHPQNDKNAYNFWKEHVVRTTGKVLLTKKFNSGITVEKLSVQQNEQPADPNYYQNLIFR